MFVLRSTTRFACIAASSGALLPQAPAQDDCDQRDRSGEERAIVKNGKIEAAHIMSVTMSCDHRAVDGALGAVLIGAFKALIENPVMMLV